MAVVVLAGLVGAGILGAAGFAVVKAGLPPTTRAQRVAVRASMWLHDYRLVHDEFRIEGRPARGACLRGWRPNPGGSARRGSFLVLESGTVWFGSGIRRVSLLRGPRQRAGVGRLAATAGCTRQLRDMLFAALQSGLPVNVSTSPRDVAGQSAIVLSLPEVRGERMTLYVSARTYRPLMAVAAAGDLKLVVRLQLVRGTPATLERLHLARFLQRGRGR